MIVTLVTRVKTYYRGEDITQYAGPFRAWHSAFMGALDQRDVIADLGYGGIKLRASHDNIRWDVCQLTENARTSDSSVHC